MQADLHTKGAATRYAPSLHTSCMEDKANRPDLLARECGRRIAEAREERGWNRPTLAARTGWTEKKPSQAQRHALSPSRLGNFEQGLRRVGYEEGAILERVLGLPAAYFMGTISKSEALVIAAMRKSA